MNEEVERIFPQVWNDLLENRKVVAQDKPLGVVLGGVPGSGKSILDPVKPISVKELYQVEQGLSQSHKLKKTKVFKR